MVVVKADAYGHGAVETARAAAGAGADALAVSTLAEGLELRRGGVDIPILMFNPLTSPEARAAVSGRITPTITSLSAAAALSLAARELRVTSPVHIMVDTGMSRSGIPLKDAPDFALKVAALPGLTVEGLYTHFAAGADHGETSLAFMTQQLRRFMRAAAVIERSGLIIPLRHAACSTAILRLPESYLDMVRVGNLFYGFGPDAGWRPAGDAAPPRVREAWSMVTRVLEVRQVPPGTAVGYGPDVRVRRHTRLATVPVGYADGVGAEVKATTFRPRARLRLFLRGLLWTLARRGLLLGPLARLNRMALSRSVFSHAGRPLDIIGRISMQQTILEVTAHPDIGAGSRIKVKVRRVLANPRVPRVYLSSGKEVASRTIAGGIPQPAGHATHHARAEDPAAGA